MDLAIVLLFYLIVVALLLFQEKLQLVLGGETPVWFKINWMKQLAVNGYVGMLLEGGGG